MPESWRGSSTACPVMTRWASPSAGPAGDPSRAAWLMPWASSGMWRCDIKLYNFSYPNLRTHYFIVYTGLNLGSFFCSLCFFSHSFHSNEFNMCHICDSHFNQLYLHSYAQRAPCLGCGHHSCTIYLPLCYFLSGVIPPITSSFLPSVHDLCPFSCLPSSTCSIMSALCVSGHFRATHFMSEVVMPIVRGILTWWGD